MHSLPCTPKLCVPGKSTCICTHTYAYVCVRKLLCVRKSPVGKLATLVINITIREWKLKAISFHVRIERSCRVQFARQNAGHLPSTVGWPFARLLLSLSIDRPVRLEGRMQVSRRRNAFTNGDSHQYKVWISYCQIIQVVYISVPVRVISTSQIGATPTSRDSFTRHGYGALSHTCCYIFTALEIPYVVRLSSACTR